MMVGTEMSRETLTPLQSPWGPSLPMILRMPSIIDLQGGDCVRHDCLRRSHCIWPIRSTMSASIYHRLQQQCWALHLLDMMYRHC